MAESELAVSRDPLLANHSLLQPASRLEGVCEGSGVESGGDSEYLRELVEVLEADAATATAPNSSHLKRMLHQLKEKKMGAVQEGSVSSSNPEEGGVLSSQQVGSMVLKALDGFLFVLNSDGEVVYVSGNVGEYLGLGQSEILRKSVYNFLDHTNADHFSKLLPDHMDLGLFGGGGMGPSEGRKSQNFNCGFRGRGGEAVDLHVSAISLPYPPSDASAHRDDFLSVFGGSDGGACLVCVARRVVEAKAEKAAEEDPPRPHQLTLLLDNRAVIHGTEFMDKNVQNLFGTGWGLGKDLRAFCQRSDSAVLAHLLDSKADYSEGTLSLSLEGGKLVRVQAWSKGAQSQPHDGDVLVPVHANVLDVHLLEPVIPGQNPMVSKAGTTTRPPQSPYYRPGPPSWAEQPSPNSAPTTPLHGPPHPAFSPSSLPPPKPANRSKARAQSANMPLDAKQEEGIGAPDMLAELCSTTIFNDTPDSYHPSDPAQYRFVDPNGANAVGSGYVTKGQPPPYPYVQQPPSYQGQGSPGPYGPYPPGPTGGHPYINHPYSYPQPSSSSTRPSKAKKPKAPRPPKNPNAPKTTKPRKKKGQPLTPQPDPVYPANALPPIRPPLQPQAGPMQQLPPMYQYQQPMSAYPPQMQQPRPSQHNSLPPHPDMIVSSSARPPADNNILKHLLGGPEDGNGNPGMMSKILCEDEARSSPTVSSSSQGQGHPEVTSSVPPSPKQRRMSNASTGAPPQSPSQGPGESVLVKLLQTNPQQHQHQMVPSSLASGTYQKAGGGEHRVVSGLAEQLLTRPRFSSPTRAPQARQHHPPPLSAPPYPHIVNGGNGQPVMMYQCPPAFNGPPSAPFQQQRAFSFDGEPSGGQEWSGQPRPTQPMEPSLFDGPGVSVDMDDESQRNMFFQQYLA